MSAKHSFLAACKRSEVLRIIRDLNIVGGDADQIDRTLVRVECPQREAVVLIAEMRREGFETFRDRPTRSEQRVRRNFSNYVR